MNTADILDLASAAHDIHGYALLAEHGDHGSCGGAWVVIPGRGNFAKQGQGNVLFPF